MFVYFVNRYLCEFANALLCVYVDVLCSVGDAACTISAASCFPEPFINEGKRLGFVHRNFAGTRFSDHVALLSVFQAWDEVRWVRRLQFFYIACSFLFIS